MEPPRPDVELIDVTPDPMPPAITAQPTELGRAIRISVVTPSGDLLLGYGDADTNTGPIDLIGYNPYTGETTTYLDDLPTEALGYFRTFSDGSLWTTSVDPQGTGNGFLVTNRGGTWHTITVAIPDFTVAVHLYDLGETSDGRISVCGSRDILPSESDVTPEDEGMAIVWSSGNGGVTWREDLAFIGARTDVYNRFWGFGRVGDRLVVSTSPHLDSPQGYYVRNPSGVWSAQKTGASFCQYANMIPWGDGYFLCGIPANVYTLDVSENLVATPLPDSTFGMAADGDYYVYTADNRTRDSNGHDLGIAVRSAAIAQDGTVYLSVSNRVIRVGDLLDP